jgi:hypothetical protein
VRVRMFQNFRVRVRARARALRAPARARARARVFWNYASDHDYLGSQDRVPFSEVGNAQFSNRASSEPDLTRVNPASPKPHSNFSPRSSNFSFLNKKNRTRLFGSGTTIENMHTDEEDSDELFELDYRVEREAVRVRLLQLLGTPPCFQV